MFRRREKQSPEQQEYSEGRVMKVLGTIHGKDGRGAAGLSLLAGWSGEDEKTVKAAALRLEARGLLRLDSLDDAYITEAGLAWYAEHRDTLPPSPRQPAG